MVLVLLKASPARRLPRDMLSQAALSPARRLSIRDMMVRTAESASARDTGLVFLAQQLSTACATASSAEETARERGICRIRSGSATAAKA